jgi:hypothetical protein
MKVVRIPVSVNNIKTIFYLFSKLLITYIKVNNITVEFYGHDANNNNITYILNHNGTESKFLIQVKQIMLTPYMNSSLSSEIVIDNAHITFNYESCYFIAIPYENSSSNIISAYNPIISDNMNLIDNQLFKITIANIYANIKIDAVTKLIKIKPYDDNHVLIYHGSKVNRLVQRIAINYFNNFKRANLDAQDLFHFVSNIDSEIIYVTNELLGIYRRDENAELYIELPSKYSSI